KVKQKFASDMDFAFSKEYLSGVLQVTQEQIDDLHMKHENFKYLVEHHADQLLLPGKSAGRGIVYVGGGKFSWLDVISIQQLRRLGSTLPVEVFIPTEEEYEAELCEFILPKLGGRCMQLAELIPQQTLQGFQITGFQYKSLALLVSHFDEILFLDSDNVPTSNVDHLFKAEPFTSTQAVFWPDSWARTTHPQLYEIMGLEVNERRKVRGNDLTNLDPATSHFHDFQGTLGNPSTETGVFMLNKRTHRKTLLLSLYYNIYGPGYYYPLMCQGGAGEGDKETFIFAGFVLKEPTYLVQKLAWWIGFHDDDEFHAKALGQHDPVSDFKRSKLVKVPEDKKPDVDLGFMHMGYPKLFPEMLMGEVLYGEGNQQHRRLYQDLTRKLGYDFEFTMWKIMAQSLCDVSDMGAKFPLTHVPGIE
ncbi:glycosyltransferase family 71 protein, partial [Babjeviella inositovora NRRL Y-12698]